GQLVGAVVQGSGHATRGELVYDAGGQLLTGTFIVYALPPAAGVPALERSVLHPAAASNPLRVKAAAEAGTARVGAALARAGAARPRPEGRRRRRTATRSPSACP